ncbi:mannosyltransferase family protein [Curtobacterium sp. B8]|uniref:mannosyltransferase family protein n=1 Tax=Curtobacterium sp. B8 TaxID=95611 RepID=UPI00034A8AA2|nr:mannosyltransferase family protein [Curtobacterium sp. B8]
MTDVAEASRASRLGAVLEARHSAWSAPLLLWLASRAFSTLLLGTLFALATANGWPFASYRRDPSFFSFSGSWDASFYRTIAEHGYPATIPVDEAGHVLPNAWAFLPVFPWVARAVEPLVGGSFWVAGVLVATAAGAGACVVLYRLVRAVRDDRAARWATALFAFGPTGFLLQVAYAESLFLLLVLGALLALVRRRYWVVAPLGVVAAFTKPGVLALAVALAVHLVVRWVQDGPRFRWRDRVVVVVSGLLVAAAGLAWPVLASGVTGRPDAYLDTELSWWVGFVGRQHFVPLTPWFTMAGTWLGPAGIVLVVAVLAGAVWFWGRRSVRALGVDVWSFTAAYALYLVAVFLPQQSLPRLLMPTAPLLGSGVFVGSRRRAVTWLVVGMCLQPVAVVLLWFLGYP